MSDQIQGSTIVDPAATNGAVNSGTTDDDRPDHPNGEAENTQAKQLEEEARKLTEADEQFIASMTGDGSPAEPDAQHDGTNRPPPEADDPDAKGGLEEEPSEDDKRLDDIESKLDPKTAGRAFKELRTKIKERETAIAELEGTATIGRQVMEFAEANGLTDDAINDALDVAAAANGNGNILQAHGYLRQMLSKIEQLAQDQHGIDLSTITTAPPSKSEANTKVAKLQKLLKNAEDWGEDPEAIEALKEQLATAQAQESKQSEPKSSQKQPTELTAAEQALLATVGEHIESTGLYEGMTTDQQRAVFNKHVIPTATRLALKDGLTEQQVAALDVPTQVAYMKKAVTAVVQGRRRAKPAEKPRTPLGQSDGKRQKRFLKPTGEKMNDEEFLQSLQGEA